MVCWGKGRRHNVGLEGSVSMIVSKGLSLDFGQEIKHLCAKHLETARDGSPVPDPTSRTDFPDTSEVFCRRNRARATALPQVSVVWNGRE
jgi:hypothetical protein